MVKGKKSSRQPSTASYPLPEATGMWLFSKTERSDVPWTDAHDEIFDGAFFGTTQTDDASATPPNSAPNDLKLMAEKQHESAIVGQSTEDDEPAFATSTTTGKLPDATPSFSASRRASFSSTFASSSLISDQKSTMASGNKPPFEVPQPWRTAMSMVSINAGLTPQLILHDYYRCQPLQTTSTETAATATAAAAKHHHHQAYTELDVGRAASAKGRRMRSVRIYHLDDDPGSIYRVVIMLDQMHSTDSNHAAMRYVTNTSIRHVLDESSAANCPLWLPVRPIHGAASSASHVDAGSVTEYQIIPCCEKWVESVDFELPLSKEELQIPGVVLRLLQEMRLKSEMLKVQEGELEKLRAELAEKGGGGRRASEAASVDSNDNDVAGEALGRPRITHLDAERLIQYWWLGAAVLAFLMVVVFR